MSDVAAILLPLNGLPTDMAALALGIRLARRFGAHLQALHVGTDSREVAPLAGEGLSGAMVEEMMTVAERDTSRRLVDARGVLRLGLEQDEAVLAGTAAPLPLVDRLPSAIGATRTATVGFRSIIGREHELVAQAARLSDLIVVPHPASGSSISSSEALHAVLFDSGRPVILAPRQLSPTIGQRISIAWNGTTESASAVLAALDWLKGADAVQVLYSNDYQRRGPEVAELIEYLAGHGVRADAMSFKRLDERVGAGLLAAAGAFGADLLVMGAYSHSRLRQLIVGGVTRHVIEKATLPVLMAR